LAARCFRARALLLRVLVALAELVGDAADRLGVVADRDREIADVVALRWHFMRLGAHALGLGHAAVLQLKHVARRGIEHHVSLAPPVADLRPQRGDLVLHPQLFRHVERLLRTAARDDDDQDREDEASHWMSSLRSASSASPPCPRTTLAALACLTSPPS